MEKSHFKRCSLDKNILSLQDLETALEVDTLEELKTLL
jgi:hypothetical protein